MKHLILISFSVLFSAFLSVAQKTMDVTLKITYRNNPLCYWDVTIKHGDIELAKGKTDDKGVVKFKYVKLLSLGIDAYGYKATANGDKKWDVKGYITLDDNGNADFDFEKLLQETGMPVGMMEAAWGLTLNDCAGSGSSSGSSSGSGTGSGSSISEQQKEDQDEWQKEQDAKAAERKAEQDQFMTDWESGKTQAEGLQNQKTQLEGKIEGLTGKINRRNGELAKLTPQSKDHSELAYEIKDLELERSLAEVKLEKTNKMIANGNAPLNKELRQDFNEREDALKAEQKQLSDDKKSGKIYGAPEEVKTEGDAKAAEEDDEESVNYYTEAEIANMSTVGLQKAKLSYNNKITTRKVSLKTKAAIMKQDKKARLEAEIVELTRLIGVMEAELTKRKEAE